MISDNYTTIVNQLRKFWLAGQLTVTEHSTNNNKENDNNKSNNGYEISSHGRVLCTVQYILGMVIAGLIASH